jgi:hypothetical protein
MIALQILTNIILPVFLLVGLGALLSALTLTACLALLGK